MAYQANKPQATDALSQSQIDIQNNFGAIQTLIDVNHVDFASSDAGKHKFVTFPAQTLPLVPPIVAGEIGLFNQSAAPTGINDLWMYRGTAAPFPITGYNGTATSGWTYIPSGLIIAWGQGTIMSGGFIQILYSSVPSFPGFSTFAAAPMLTRLKNSTGADFLIADIFTHPPANTAGFIARSSQGLNNVVFGWMTIGL